MSDIVCCHQLGYTNVMSYPIPECAVDTVYEIKKSKFITRAFMAKDREQGMAELARIKLAYPDARHHCWAYLLGDPAMPRSVAMADDGEPSGTAGKPILNVLQHKGVGDVMIVVTRYFGGIKLGAGGLVRAYSAAAQQAMEQLPTIERVTRQEVRLKLDFKHEQYFRNWASTHDAEVVACDYGQWVILTLGIVEQTAEALAHVTGNLGVEIISN